MKNFKPAIWTFVTLSIIVLVIGIASISILKQKEKEMMVELAKQEEMEYQQKIASQHEFDIKLKEITDKVSAQATVEEAKKQQKITLAQIAEEKRIAEEKAKAERERLAKIEAEKQRKIALAEVQKKQQAQSKSEEKKVYVASNVSRSSGIRYTYEMTSYTASCKGCSGITASGYDVRNTVHYNGMRIVAVPPQIPLGTVMRITLPNGNSFTAIGLDRGGAIKGKKLDYLVGSYDEAVSNGRMKVTIEIIK